MVGIKNNKDGKQMKIKRGHQIPELAAGGNKK